MLNWDYLALLSYGDVLSHASTQGIMYAKYSAFNLLALEKCILIFTGTDNGRLVVVITYPALSGQTYYATTRHTFRAETKAPTGGAHTHTFTPRLTNFPRNQLSLPLISKEIRRAEREHTNMPPPNQRSRFGPAHVGTETSEEDKKTPKRT